VRSDDQQDTIAVAVWLVYPLCETELEVLRGQGGILEGNWWKEDCVLG
jgi:hypothetical protein